VSDRPPKRPRTDVQVPVKREPEPEREESLDPSEISEMLDEVSRDSDLPCLICAIDHDGSGYRRRRRGRAQQSAFRHVVEQGRLAEAWSESTDWMIFWP
jgi:hypothetical protein